MKTKIIEYLTGYRSNFYYYIQNEMILGTDEPVRAVRRKKNASMVLAAQEVAEGRADACISAGNTGALMAAGLFIVGRIKGIERPALAPTLPTIGWRRFCLIGCGCQCGCKTRTSCAKCINGFHL